MLTTYWGGLCEGVTRLENGEKFDTDTYYNKKLLKYSVDEIKQALIFSALKYGSNKKLYEACQITYSYLACFEKNALTQNIFAILWKNVLNHISIKLIIKI